MKISIVTAVCNAMPWVQETVQSVLSQNCPDLEYLVLDGASTDGTREYLESQREHFAALVCKPNEGQYAAIAEGMSRASGEILGWVNDGSKMMPWTLKLVTRIFREFPSVDWITGIPVYLNADSECILWSPVAASYPRRYLANGWFREGVLGSVMQANTFWRRRLWDRVGGLDLEWQHAGDFNLWIRFAEQADLTAVTTSLGAQHVWPDRANSPEEIAYRAEVVRRCKNLPQYPSPWKLLTRLGPTGQSILRMLLWAKTPVIKHSAQWQGGNWALCETYRPVSRTDVFRLMLERNLRKGAG